ncbi:hypothetical protein E2I00_008438, partial [Balaenoptera physalus]
NRLPTIDKISYKDADQRELFLDVVHQNNLHTSMKSYQWYILALELFYVVKTSQKETKNSPKGYKRNAWDNLLFESHSQHHLGLLKTRTASDMDKDYSKENVVSSNPSSDRPPPPLESIERAAERNSRPDLLCSLLHKYGKGFTLSQPLSMFINKTKQKYNQDHTEWNKPGTPFCSPTATISRPAFALLLIKKDVCSSETKKGLLQKVKHTVSAAARDSLNTYITNLEFEVHYYIICKASGLTISQHTYFRFLITESLSHGEYLHYYPCTWSRKSNFKSQSCIALWIDPKSQNEWSLARVYRDRSHCLGCDDDDEPASSPDTGFAEAYFQVMPEPMELRSPKQSLSQILTDKVKKGIRERLTGAGGSLKTRENRLKALRSKKEDDDIKIATEYAYKYCPKTEAEEQKYNLKLHVFLIPIGFSVLSAIDSSSSGHYTSDAYNI